MSASRRRSIGCRFCKGFSLKTGKPAFRLPQPAPSPVFHTPRKRQMVAKIIVLNQIHQMRPKAARLGGVGFNLLNLRRQSRCLRFQAVPSRLHLAFQAVNAGNKLAIARHKLCQSGVGKHLCLLLKTLAVGYQSSHTLPCSSLASAPNSHRPKHSNTCPIAVAVAVAVIVWSG